MYHEKPSEHVIQESTRASLYTLLGMDLPDVLTTNEENNLSKLISTFAQARFLLPLKKYHIAFKCAKNMSHLVTVLCLGNREIMAILFHEVPP